MKSRLAFLIGLGVLAAALSAGLATTRTASAASQVVVPSDHVGIGSCGRDANNGLPDIDYCSWSGSGATPSIGNNSCTAANSCIQLTQGITIGNNSCTDGYACQASKGDVGDGSCFGDKACNSASRVGNGSCIGDEACFFAAYSVGNGSCRGDQACYFAQGSVGNGSCNGDTSPCIDIPGTVGDCAENDPGYECGQLTLRKFLFPSYDSGRFDLLIDDDVEAAAVGHNGSSGAVDVGYGGRIVSEAAVAPARLANYRTTIVCQDTSSRAIVGFGYTPTLTVYVAPESDVVCTLINQRLLTWFWWR